MMKHRVNVGRQVTYRFVGIQSKHPSTHLDPLTSNKLRQLAVLERASRESPSYALTCLCPLWI